MTTTLDLSTRRRGYSDDVIDLWLSATGSNTAAGTQGAPLENMEEALGRLCSNPWGRRAVIHCLAGYNETVNHRLDCPPILGSGVDAVALDASDPSWNYIRGHLVIQAEPVTVEDINGTISVDAANAGNGLITITDSSKAWTTDQHVGRGLINVGAPAEAGMIWGNNATQLFVSSVNGAFSDGTLRIVRRDANLTVGDPASFDPAGFRIEATMGTLALVGMTIKAASGVPTALDILTHGSVAMLLCEVQGGLQTRAASNTLTVDNCYVHGGALAPNAGSVAFRQSFLSNLTAAFHAVNGQYDIFGCRVKGCGPLGHGGTSTPHGGFRIDNSWISDGTSHGVLYSGGGRSRVTSSRIDSCVGDGIHADGCGNLLVNTVVGSGNGGYGCSITNGAQVATGGGVNTLAGAGGAQVRLGGITYTWSQAPQKDDATYSRLLVS